MTTRSTNIARTMELGEVAEYPVIAADIIYEGSAVGLVAASGHARPLTSADTFVGFAEAKVDNSAGSAAALNVRTRKKSTILLPITGAVITDVGLPVYATDDDTFTFNPAGAVFIGFTRKFHASGYMTVDFNCGVYQDPFAGYFAETISDNKTLDAQDSGKLFYSTVDAKTFTLPAVEGMNDFIIMNGGAFGTIAVTVSPNSADMIEMRDITAADDKDLVNTKATACRGDYLLIGYADSNGWVVKKARGVWARET